MLRDENFGHPPGNTWQAVISMSFPHSPDHSNMRTERGAETSNRMTEYYMFFDERASRRGPTNPVCDFYVKNRNKKNEPQSNGTESRWR